MGPVWFSLNFYGTSSNFNNSHFYIVTAAFLSMPRPSSPFGLGSGLPRMLLFFSLNMAVVRTEPQACPVWSVHASAAGI